MPSRATHVIRIAACVTALAAASAAPPASACKIVYGGLPSTDQTYMMVTATADTLAAGAGSIRFDLEGATEPPRVFGQVFTVQQVGGRGAARLAGARVVVVPWATAADCSTRLWGQGDHEPGDRIAAGSTGLVLATLRPRSQWAGNVPTFDVQHADAFPLLYDGTTRYDGPHVSPADLFAAYRALVPAIAADSARSETILARWIERHPALAAQRPLSQMLEGEYELAADLRAAKLTLPFTGTYRLTIRAGTTPPIQLYMRTSARAQSAVDYAQVSGAPAPPHRLELTGVTLYAHPTRHAAALPVRWPAWDGRERCSALEISAAVPPARGRGTRTLAGEIDLTMLARCFADNPAIQAAAAAYGNASGGEGDKRYGGEFRILADGRVTFEQRFGRGAEELLRITGVRISRTTVPE